MKNTKELILVTALDLFNQEGLSQVTLRTIANKMGISQGNLNYHYKKRATIIEALYFQLVHKIDDSMVQNKSDTIGLHSLFNRSNIIMNSFYEYRFFMLDFVQIMRENDKIKTHYLELTQLRQEQFALLFDHLINIKILRKEILPNEYAYLYQRFQILGNFWISSAATSKSKLNKKAIKEYAEILNQGIFPYLTEEGRTEYYEINSVD